MPKVLKDLRRERTKLANATKKPKQLVKRLVYCPLIDSKVFEIRCLGAINTQPCPHGKGQRGCSLRRTVKCPLLPKVIAQSEAGYKIETMQRIYLGACQRCEQYIKDTEKCKLKVKEKKQKKLKAPPEEEEVGQAIDAEETLGENIEESDEENLEDLLPEMREGF